MPLNVFAPYERLAEQLLADAPESDDAAHDGAHLARVWANVRRIQAIEGGDAELLCAATLLHDGVAVEKNDPRRAQASRMAADVARARLAALGWARTRIEGAAHAIEAHSHSANIEPRTLEACILQDADRLDAIGALGIARCFYTAGRMGSRLYDADDPGAQRRALDDRRYALDHFPAKLLRLGEGFRTDAGRALASQRIAVMRDYLDALFTEIGAPPG